MTDEVSNESRWIAAVESSAGERGWAAQLVATGLSSRALPPPVAVLVLACCVWRVASGESTALMTNAWRCGLRARHSDAPRPNIMKCAVLVCSAAALSVLWFASSP